MPHKDPQKAREYHRKYYEENREKTHEDRRKYREKNREKQCEYRENNRETARAASREWRKANYAKVMLNSARAHAHDKKFPFSIELNDINIPEFCPVFGHRLELGVGKQSPNSPSLDRIDSTKGYVKGNVWIISWRANRLKSDATFGELQRLSMAWYEKNRSSQPVAEGRAA